MFYAKAVNCCAEVRDILADACAATPTACAGSCADLANVFASTPVPPAFPDGMADYVCQAFPNDDSSVRVRPPQHAHWDTT
jgi:hypothetical protein